MRVLLILAASVYSLTGWIQLGLAQELPEVSGEHLHLRGSLTNSKLVFENSGKGHVAFIGGSITAMNGYRPMVSNFLQKRFPQTKFTFTDAGLSSTCSMTGAHRLTRDVLSRGNVDLIFIEFAVNDDQDAGHDAIHARRGMEGLLAQVRRHNPYADIVVTHFANQGMMNTIRAGEVPIPILAHNQVCEHYQVSTNDLCSELTDLIDARKTTWELYGGVHPKPYGNSICTILIKQLLERGWKSEVTEIVKHPVPIQPIDEQSYMNGRLVAPDRAVYDKSWEVSVPVWKELMGSFRSTYAGQKALHGKTVGSEFSITFTGRSLGAFVLAGPDAGALEITVDDVKLQRGVNLYHRHSFSLHYPRTVMLAEGLEHGKHTVTVRISPARDAQSHGSYARILNFTAN